jgi:hypothetical protein
MNINWLVADSGVQFLPDQIKQIKEIGSIWGGWRTWKLCQTDNVVCHDTIQAQTLIDSNFQSLCNFYVPKDLYNKLNQPADIRVYAGEFVHEIQQPDDLVAMHLVATVSDIVLMLGFDCVTMVDTQSHVNYRNLIQQAMIQNKQTQWVILNQTGSLWTELTTVSNLSQDTFKQVIEQLQH